MTEARFTRDYNKDGETVVVRRGFGFKDNKGREFGALVRLTTVVFVPHTEGQSWNPGVTHAGTHFEFWPHATRGGESYGALQTRTYFDTEAKRDAAVEAYFKAAEKRAAKNKARA